MLAWWQLALLDVYAVIAAAVLTVLSLAAGLLWPLYRAVRRAVGRGGKVKRQ